MQSPKLSPQHQNRKNEKDLNQPWIVVTLPTHSSWVPQGYIRMGAVLAGPEGIWKNSLI